MIYFPHPLSADEDGLLAIGGELSAQRLSLAYSFGIFPWYNQSPILWWFTHPRAVLLPSQVKISKSTKQTMRNSVWKITADVAFETVIDRCAQIKRKGQQGTWISTEIKEAYLDLHRQDRAHSIEIWEDSTLIGGLYGVTFGKIFYGESMFAERANASKIGLIYLCQYLEYLGCTLIDCQQDTPHLRSMGTVLYSKEKFWSIVKHNTLEVDLDFGSASFSDWLSLKKTTVN